MAPGKKKSAKKAASAPASGPATEGEKAVASGKLHRAVFHNGRMYDPKRKGDAAAFAAMVKSTKDGDKHAQKLADKGVISGFGTRGAGKGKKGESAEAPGGASEAGDAIGGGVEGTDDEEELTEDEE